MTKLQAKRCLLVALAAIALGCSSSRREPVQDQTLTSSSPQGLTCVCPEGYVPDGDACCPACYYLTPPCLLPCLLCTEFCGDTGDPCNYGVDPPMTCCGGASVCCPAGATSTCSDVACAND